LLIIGEEKNLVFKKFWENSSKKGKKRGITKENAITIIPSNLSGIDLKMA